MQCMSDATYLSTVVSKLLKGAILLQISLQLIKLSECKHGAVPVSMPGDI